MLIPCYDANGQPMPDADIDAAEWQSMVDLVANYPPTRLNPWLRGEFLIGADLMDLYIRHEGGTFTEIRVMGLANG